MNRPYVICHMVTSIDGKVTGEFLSSQSCAKACEIYYDKPLFMDGTAQDFELIKTETKDGVIVLNYKRK